MDAPTPRAVFLSYAHEDMDAARNIAQALQQGGIEVWLDQEELRGADAWDAKIRRQIKDCALFLPLISKHTQRRTEGYFRREWKLAVQRLDDIAEEVPFLVPVVIDGTTEAEALVPEAFRAVQWTRLNPNATPAEFVRHVAALLRGDVKRPAVRMGGGRPTKSVARRIALWTAVAVAVAAAAAAAFYYSPTRQAARLTTAARELIFDSDTTRNDFALAESWMKRAAELAPESGKVWGTYAALHALYRRRNFERTEQRAVRTQADANKALRLDPRNTDALVALGIHWRLAGDRELSSSLLQRARTAEPQNQLIVIQEAYLIPDVRERVKFQIDAARAISPNHELFYNAANNLRAVRAWSESAALYERAIASKPFWRIYVNRAQAEYHLTGDPEKMTAWLDHVPPDKREEPRLALMRFTTAMIRRDAAAALRAVAAVTADDFRDNAFSGPKAYLIAQAYQLANQPAYATTAWNMAERKLRSEMNDLPGTRASAQLAVTLAALGRHEEARKLADQLLERRSLGGRTLVDLAHAFSLLNDSSRAIAALRRVVKISDPMLSAFGLLKEPRWDPICSHPEFDSLVQEYAKADGVTVELPAKIAPSRASAKKDPDA